MKEEKKKGKKTHPQTQTRKWQGSRKARGEG